MATTSLCVSHALRLKMPSEFRPGGCREAVCRILARFVRKSLPGEKSKGWNSTAALFPESVGAKIF